MKKALTLGLTALILTLTMPAISAELPESTPKIIEHLSFLGYNCEKQIDDPKNHYVLVQHEKEWNFIVLRSGGGVSLIMSFNIKPESLKKRSQLLELINDINSNQVWLPQVYIYKNQNGVESFKFQAWMPDNYNKSAFSAFIQRWVEDTNAAAQALKAHLYFED